MGTNRGFLLLEVMVAVTIVGIALAAVLQLISSSLGAARITEDYAHASRLLGEKLWEIQTLEALEPGVREGSLPSADGREPSRYKYRIAVQDLFESSQDAQDAPHALGHVTVTFSWKHRGTKSIVAETYHRLAAVQSLSGFPVER